ncbi:MAG TPA: Smr/MutS family protein [Syntrophales bacterium]|nr:Smr/MutS family protein [Syntrophales bacterium]
MKSPKPPLTFRPFLGLRRVRPRHEDKAGARPQTQKEDISEQDLFREAMSDVKPMPESNLIPGSAGRREGTRPLPHPDGDAVNSLKLLVAGGEGFVISDTPEYIEGTGHNIHPEIAGRLHRGDFSIQDYIDLHGLNVEGAREAFDSFLHNSIRSGKRAILVIHGRGLSSPGDPVLKSRVHEWISRGSWRKWIIAFSSARLCDGGAGATYILLRSRPATKRMRKPRKA